MTLLARFLAWLVPEWATPHPYTPASRRRLRATCEVCGKDLAVVRSTGRVWRHRCQREAPDATA
jgi:hypothetical protein